MSSTETRTLYLHIGLPKTGSTALQCFFKENVEQLRQVGLSYPTSSIRKSGLFDSHAGNGFALSPLHPTYSKREHDNLLNEIVAQPTPNVLISSEYLSQLTGEDIKELRSKLTQFKFKIIAYLRRADSYTESCFQQLVKNHGANAKSKVVTTAARKSVEELVALLSHFEEENVIIRPYERQQFVDGTIFSDFMDAVGLELTDEYHVPNKIINPGFDRDYLELRMMLNSAGIPKGRIQNVFTNSLWSMSHTMSTQTVFKKSTIFPPEMRKKVVEDCEELYQFIARDYMGRKDGRIFLDPLPSPDDAWEAYDGPPLEKVVLGFGAICSNLQSQIDQQKATIDLLSRRIQKVSSVRTRHVPSFLVRNFPERFSVVNMTSLGKVAGVNQDVKSVVQSERYIEIESVGSMASLSVKAPMPFKAGRTYFVQITIQTPESTSLRVLWRPAGVSFSHEASVSSPLEEGDNTVWLCIGPQCPGSFLRVDPGNVAGRYIISKFNVVVCAFPRNSDHRLKWNLRP
ncbi:hypothetical protein [Pseudodesulfovibrio profundus]|uniref:hypothetical protein n=1 Tax=Pseudodesulfovibrio profundus TaxID=57320 RepID=UPI000BE2FF4F|nr:hypothetical protein [Pseudodesulfovibrio profundus]